MGAVVFLGEGAKLIDRAGTVPFDDYDEFVSMMPPERWLLPLENRGGLTSPVARRSGPGSRRRYTVNWRAEGFDSQGGG